MPPQLINLDCNATTPLLPDVAEAMRDAALRYPGNPASQHELGRQARRALEQARSRIAELLGAARDDRVVFTSGGTEANNLALTGLIAGAGDASGGFAAGAQPTPAAPGRILISPLEHPSVARAADGLVAAGCDVVRAPVAGDGVVTAAAIAARLTPATRLVSVMLASNETGVIQPLAHIAAACRERGMILHTDAAQVVGKLPVDFRALGVDALTLAAHKFHGPLGIGALVLRHGVALEPALRGGFQQAALRPGTESVALAVGMCSALESWASEADERRERMTALRDRLECALLGGDPSAVVIGAGSPRLPSTSNIAFVGLDRQALAMALDLAGVACSTGSACASGSSEPSPALLAMGLSEEQISSSLRLSLGAQTTAGEIDEAARRILSVVNRLRQE